MAVIQTTNLSKIYNKENIPVYALNDVDLKIEAGEFTSIVGPSGSGKTTMLNMIGGLDKPTHGKVEVNNTDLGTLSDSQLIDFRLNHIGFVFQAFNLIPVLTALENISFLLQMQGRSDKECRERSEELLVSVGLQDRMHNRPNQLSGGQQQRVAVARALASRPDFVLADEPTASLDSKSSANLLDMMLNLNEEQNVTFIFSTHDPRVIKRARRVVMLEDGEIIQDKQKESGTPYETSSLAD